MPLLNAVAFGGDGMAEHAENGSAASDVEDDLVLENVSVLVDGVSV